MTVRDDVWLAVAIHVRYQDTDAGIRVVKVTVREAKGPVAIATQDGSRIPISHLIAFTAWSSFAHAAVMAVQAFRNVIARGELLGVAALVVIGVALIVLAPAKPSGERTSAAAA